VKKLKKAMLLVLTCAVFLLLVMPAALLRLGRMIEANTDGQPRLRAIRLRAIRAKRAAAQGDPSRAAWFRQPMKPAFKSFRSTV